MQGHFTVCDGDAYSVLQNQGIAEEATNAQIDTLILDNRQKLNAIIGS